MASVIETLDKVRQQLEAIIGNAPDSKPEIEDYDDTESAFDNGHECAAWNAAVHARKALRLLQGKATAGAAVCVIAAVCSGTQARAEWIPVDDSYATQLWAMLPPPSPVGARPGPCLPDAVRDFLAMRARGLQVAIVTGRMPNGQTHALVEREIDGAAVGAGAWAITAGFVPLSALDASHLWVWSE